VFPKNEINSRPMEKILFHKAVLVVAVINAGDGSQC
jgi:hypothetical protein